MGDSGTGGDEAPMNPRDATIDFGDARVDLPEERPGTAPTTEIGRAHV